MHPLRQAQEAIRLEQSANYTRRMQRPVEELQSSAQKLFGAEPARGRRSGQNEVLYAIWIAALVFTGYFLGAKIGIAFGFPATEMSVFWPPNIVLIAALLLTPRRIWWVIIVAALPAEFMAASFPGAPAYVAGLNYAGNAGQALLTVFLLQRFCGGLPRFDNFQSTAWFIAIAAFFAPALVSFLVAAASVLTGWISDFWLIWQARFLTDALSVLTLLPPLLLLLTAGLSRLRRVRALRARYLEAGLLALSLCIIGNLVLADRLPQLILRPTPPTCWMKAWHWLTMRSNRCATCRCCSGRPCWMIWAWRRRCAGFPTARPNVLATA
jgi:integral membrane sensor domain MASE1